MAKESNSKPKGAKVTRTPDGGVRFEYQNKTKGGKKTTTYEYPPKKK